MTPADRVRAIIADNGWPCRLHPDCTEADWAAWLASFEPPVKLGRCPECGGRLELRSGRYGQFAGCENYPGCRYTCDVLEARPGVQRVTDEDLQQHADRFRELQRRAWEHVRS